MWLSQVKLMSFTFQSLNCLMLNYIYLISKRFHSMMYSGVKRFFGLGHEMFRGENYSGEL